MGAVYRRKRRSCPHCKGNKAGGSPARTPRERDTIKRTDKEIRDNKGKK